MIKEIYRLDKTSKTRRYLYSLFFQNLIEAINSAQDDLNGYDVSIIDLEKSKEVVSFRTVK